MLSKILAIIMLPSVAFGTVLFETSFESDGGWQSIQQTGGINWQDTNQWACDIHCPPSGWTYYRDSDSWLSPNPNPSFQVQSASAHSGTLGLTYNTEAKQQEWSGGGIAKFLGETGYQDLYVAFWLKFPSTFTWGAVPLSASTLWKPIRITRNWGDWSSPPTSLIYEPSDFNTTADNRPTFYPDFYYRLSPYADGGAILNTQTRYDNGTEWAYGFEDSFPSALMLPDADIGEWHHIEYRVRMNTAPGVADGIATVWRDGAVIWTKTDIPWVSAGGSLARGWNHVVFPDNIYMGDDSFATGVEQPVYFDDFVVSTSYIGQDYVIKGGAPTSGLNNTHATLKTGNTHATRKVGNTAATIQ